MRSSNIEITMKIPIPIETPDLNGNIYEKSAIEDAIKNVNCPIPLLLEQDKVAGVVNSLWLDKNFNMTAKGVVFFGGTNENAVLDEKSKTVTTMEILAIGLDKGEK